MELEKVKMDFYRDLEQEKKLILEKAQGDNGENGGASGGNISR